jgi:phosphatase NudJ
MKAIMGAQSRVGTCWYWLQRAQKFHRQHRPRVCPGYDELMSSRWSAKVTVAAVIEREGRYLLVEEHTPEGLRLNNPAGHLDPGESLVQAVAREALEETAHPFTPTQVVGVYLARMVRERTGEDVSYLRIAFAGTVGEAIEGRALDRGIVRTLWLTREEIAAQTARHRSPLLARCIADHAAGQRFALDLLYADPSVYRSVSG